MHLEGLLSKQTNKQNPEIVKATGVALKLSLSNKTNWGNPKKHTVCYKEKQINYKQNGFISIPKKQQHVLEQFVCLFV